MQNTDPPVESQSEAAARFEERIRTLLKNFGMEKVSGGTTTVIGNQIDAIGIIENKIVIVECTTQYTNHRGKIEGLLGKRPAIKAALQNHDVYGAAFRANPDVTFIYATNNNGVPSDTIGMFEDKKYGLKIWQGEMVRYYERIAKAIPSRAKYDLLSDLGYKPSKNEQLTVYAFRYNYDHTDMYLFYADPLELIRFTYVPRRESGREGYYQRLIDPNRLKDIAEHLRKSKRAIPTNVVLAMDAPKFERLKLDDEAPPWAEFGKLTFPPSYNGGMVIDGQHRLFSFQKGMKQKLPIVAFGRLNITEQMKYFVDINKNAKPIQPNLLWDLQGDLNPNGEEGIISNVVKELNKTTPLVGRISVGGSSGPINMNSLCGSIQRQQLIKQQFKLGKKNLFKNNPLYSSDVNQLRANVVKALRDYFTVLLACLRPDASKIVYDNGTSSVLIYLYKILLMVDGTKGNTRIKETFVPALANFLNERTARELKSYASKGASEGGKSEILGEWINVLRPVEPTISDFAPEIRDSLSESLKEYETEMTHYLQERFTGRPLEQLQKQVADKIWSLEKKIGKKNYDAIDLLNQLTLGEKTMLFKRDFQSTKNQIGPAFIRAEDATIDDLRYFDESELFRNMDKVVEVRNRYSHPNPDPKMIVTNFEKDEIIRVADRFTRLLRRQAINEEAKEIALVDRPV